MDGGQSAAIMESLGFYACHAVGNRDGGQSAAIAEYIKY